MNDDPLFQAILAEPDDLALRLVYADKLEDAGDPRGEFIRVQLALDGDVSDDEECSRLLEREQVLHFQHSEEWEHSPVPAVRFGSCRRGFPEVARVNSWAGFFESREEVFQCAPFTSLVFPKFPFLEEAHATHELEQFLAMPGLRRLKSLSLVNAGLTTVQAELLAHCPNLTRLERLHLDRNRLFHPGAVALLSSENLPRLQVLSMAHNEIHAGPKVAGRIALSALTELDLHHNTLAQDGLITLGIASGSSTTSCTLRRLDVSSNALNDAAAKRLAEEPSLTRLESLNLRHNSFSDEGIVALLRSRFLRALRNLGIETDNLQTETLRQVYERFPNFPAALGIE